VDDPSHPVHNPFPQLLQTPSGLALLELQGTINVPTSEAEHDDPSDENCIAQSTSYETPIGKLMFPDYSIHNLER
jgi:chromosome transmission fidelity protein 8